MFLTESTKVYGGKTVSASPTTGWQMLYESEMVWHKLEMGMTKLEHNAIVNEDKRLLNEGVSEFFKKAKRWFQWAGQEFLRYLDKVIDTWVNIQNKIRTWLVDAEELKRRLTGSGTGEKKNKEIKISKKHFQYIQDGMEIAGSAETMKALVDTAITEAQAKHHDSEDLKDAIAAKFKGKSRYALYIVGAAEAMSQDERNSDYGDVVLRGEDITKAINFAKDGRVRAIKTLQYVRNALAKLINMGIKSADNEDEDVNVIKKWSSKVRESANRMISEINKATNACIAAFGKAKSKGGYKDAQKAQFSYFFD